MKNVRSVHKYSSGTAVLYRISILVQMQLSYQKLFKLLRVCPFQEFCFHSTRNFELTHNFFPVKFHVPNYINILVTETAQDEGSTFLRNIGPKIILQRLRTTNTMI
jgi:hypothetical protein